MDHQENGSSELWIIRIMDHQDNGQSR